MYSEYTTHFTHSIQFMCILYNLYCIVHIDYIYITDSWLYGLWFSQTLRHKNYIYVYIYIYDASFLICVLSNANFNVLYLSLGK